MLDDDLLSDFDSDNDNFPDYSRNIVEPVVEAQQQMPIENMRKFNSLPVHKWDIQFNGKTENGEVLEFLRNIKEMSVSERVDSEELRRRANFLFVGEQELGFKPTILSIQLGKL